MEKAKQELIADITEKINCLLKTDFEDLNASELIDLELILQRLVMKYLR